MTRVHRLFLARHKATVLAIVVVLFCTSAAFAGGNDHAAIKTASTEWVAAFNAGDLESMAALTTEDIVLLPEYTEPVRGRDAVVAIWHQAVDNGLEIELATEELVASGGLAYQMGVFSYLVPQGTVVKTRKFLRIWKRTDGLWRLHRSMYSSNKPGTRDLPTPLPPPKDPVLDENSQPREPQG